MRALREEPGTSATAASSQSTHLRRKPTLILVALLFRADATTINVSEGGQSARFRAVTAESLIGDHICRKLALAADRFLWAVHRNECATIVAQIYNMFDGLEHGLDPTLRDRVVAIETSVWIGDIGRCAELLGVVLG